jgi:hypothetical protein
MTFPASRSSTCSSLAKTRDRLVRRDAEPAKLVRQERAREADVEPPARDGIEHADLAGQLERIVEDREHRAGYQRTRPLRSGAQEYDRVGAVAAVGLKIVPTVRTCVKPSLSASAAMSKGRGNNRGPASLRRHVGEKLQPELHG